MALGTIPKPTENKIKKVCIVCGADFFVFRCLQRIKCCSRVCRDKHMVGRLVGKKLRKLAKTCESCGVSFESLRSLYCVDCRKAIRRAYMRQEMQRRYMDPQWASRLRAYAKTAADNTQADPERRRRRNLRNAAAEGRRRALEKGTRAGRISYLRVLSVHGTTCYLCCMPIAEKDLSFDHVIPLVREGTHTEDNLRPAHINCNRRKNRKLVEELSWR